jgi:ribonuclease P protein component
VAGIRWETASTSWFQRLASIEATPTYTHSYPQVWITGEEPLARTFRTGRVTEPQLSTARKPVARAIARRLTCPGAMPTLARFCRRWSGHERGSRIDEADISAECAPQEEDARLPEPDGDQGRPQGAQAAAGEGAQTTDGIAGRLPRRERLTSTSEFQALFRNGQRVERPLMVVLWREAAAVPVRRAGFTVSRQVRGAVARNRIRRRLREAYRGSRGSAPARVSLVVIGRPALLRAPMAAVIGQMRRAFRSIPGTRSA